MNGLMQVGRTDLIESLLGGITADELQKLTIIVDNLQKLRELRSNKYLMILLMVASISLVLFFISITYPTLPMGWKRPLAGDGYNIIEFSRKLLNTMSNDESSSYIQTMESHSSNDSATKCNPPGFDLPTIHHNDFFIGRGNDISMVISMMAYAHIININGAPGIGKSTLAIHVGYKLLRNGTSVRYINMGEKISLFKGSMNSNERFSTVVHDLEQTEEIESVIEIDIPSLQTVESRRSCEKSDYI